MIWELEYLPEALDDLASLDNSVRKPVIKGNEGSPGQALKRLLGLRTFGSPAAQTLASHTSFAGM